MSSTISHYYLGKIAEFIKLSVNEFQRFTQWIVTYVDFNVVLVYTCLVSHTVSTYPTIFFNNLPQGHVFQINANMFASFM